MKLILIFTFISVFSITYSQKQCGVDYLIAHPENIYIPPSLLNEKNILKQSNVEIVDNSVPKPAVISPDYPYPPLPGFNPF